MADTLSTLKKHVESLIKEHGENAPVVFDLFLAEDVKTLAEERGVTLNNKEIEDVLSATERNKDASIGLNWDSIGAAMDYVLD